MLLELALDRTRLLCRNGDNIQFEKDWTWEGPNPDKLEDKKIYPFGEEYPAVCFGSIYVDETHRLRRQRRHTHVPESTAKCAFSRLQSAKCTLTFRLTIRSARMTGSASTDRHEDRHSQRPVRAQRHHSSQSGHLPQCEKRRTIITNIERKSSHSALILVHLS